MILLVTVTLFGAIVAVAATLWQGPQIAAAETGSRNDTPPFHVVADRDLARDLAPDLAADRTPVRVVGSPFVPNLNPREH